MVFTRCGVCGPPWLRTGLSARRRRHRCRRRWNVSADGPGCGADPADRMEVEVEVFVLRHDNPAPHGYGSVRFCESDLQRVGVLAESTI